MPDDRPRPRSAIADFFATAVVELMEVGGRLKLAEERERHLTTAQHEEDARLLRDKGEAL